MLGITPEDKAPVYWNNVGRFSKAASRIYAVIPSHGYAPTIATELVRCVSSINYDRFNNGCGNRDGRGPHSQREKAKFLRKFKDDVCELIVDNPMYFPYSPARFKEACLPILQLRGGAFNQNEAADIVCDGFIALAMVKSGEPLGAFGDELAFLDAIDASPKERATRLVYADWLEERSLEERAMAVRVHAHLIF